MGEPFVPAKPKPTAFAGRGQRLGDSVEPPATAATTTTTTYQSSPPPPAVDPSQPTTNLQVRLADGSRINATFNATTTIAELHAYVAQQLVRGGAGDRIRLLAGRPPLGLAPDDGRTLQEAGLLNSVVMQQAL